jgi:hypothetical protein
MAQRETDMVRGRKRVADAVGGRRTEHGQDTGGRGKGVKGKDA